MSAALNSSNHYMLKVLHSFPYSIEWKICAEEVINRVPLTTFNIECSYPGLVPEILGIIRQKTNINIEVRYHQNYTQILEAVANGTADTTGYLFPTDGAPIGHARFTYNPTMTVGYSVLAWDSDEQAEALSFVRVFSPQLWFIVITCLMLYRTYSKLFKWVQQNGQESPDTLMGHYDYSVELLKWFKPMLLLMISLFTFNLYSNAILTGLMVKSKPQLFTDLEGLVRLLDSDKVQLARYVDELDLDEVFERNRHMQNLGSTSVPAVTDFERVIAEHPPSALSFYDQHPDQIDSALRNSMLFYDRTPANEVRRAQYCHTRVVSLEPDILFEFQLYFMFGIRTPQWVIDEFDRVIVEYQHMIATSKARYETYVKSNRKMCPTEATVGDQFHLHINQCKFVFVMLLGGLIVALALCITENVVDKAIKKLWTSKSLQISSASCN